MTAKLLKLNINQKRIKAKNAFVRFLLIKYRLKKKLKILKNLSQKIFLGIIYKSDGEKDMAKVAKLCRRGAFAGLSFFKSLDIN